MIPKIIHYCWFGGNPLPELAQKCINSWKTFLPDFEIKEWNESNYDLTKNAYMAAAYKEKKWGFVPDYIRSDLIYTYGGFYLDTDVEIIKSFDNLINYTGIMGFESETYVNGGNIVAGEPGLNIFKEMRDIYENINFYNNDGSLNLKPSPVYNTEVLEKYGLIRNNSLQTIGEITVFPTEYFCPKDFNTGLVNITSNTYTIHHYDGSWCSEYDKLVSKITYSIYKHFGKNVFSKALVIFYRIFSKFKEFGFSRTMHYYLKGEKLQ